MNSVAPGDANDVGAAMRRAWDAYRAGDRAAADRLCRAALSVDPSLAEAAYLLGVIAMDSGKPDVALDHFRQASRLRPDVAPFHNAMGEAYRASGNVAGAIAAFQAALAVRKEYARPHLNLGLIEHSNGNLSAAAARFTQAIQIDPRYATAHNALGAVFHATGRPDAAGEHFREAIAVDPEYPEAHFNFATILLGQGNPAEALTHLHTAIRCRPSYARAHAMAGTALFESGQVTAAVASFQAAVRLRPDDAETFIRLGDALRLLGRMEEAGAALDQALRLRPGNPHAFASRFRLKAETCDWRNWAADLDRLWADAMQALQPGRTPAIHPMFALSLPWPAERQVAIARGYAKTFEWLAGPIAASHDRPAGERRLRIGYLSRDFYDHPVAHQMQSIFGLHDRNRFEIHAYSFGPDDGSGYRRRIEADCEHFHDLATLSAEQLAERIRADGIDILIDLMGYSGFARPECLARRPAPVQVSWLGYPGTTGAAFIDYLIGDAIVTPAADSGAFSETIVRMPQSYMPTDRDQRIGTTAPKRADHGLPGHGIVFCCFNNAHKIEPEVFGAWMRILSHIPGSAAWLSIRETRAQANLRREAEARGVAGERLIFAPHVASKADHLARLQLADLFLDTRYYNAHATACDALRAGLPVLTCPADTFASRVGASLLSAVGLPDLIATTLADYERIAIELATHPDALGAVRQRLCEARGVAPLFDAARFVCNLERACQSMWDAFIANRTGEAIDVRE